MSFLRSEGHLESAHYPLCALWSEETIARRRINAQHATAAILLQQAVLTAWPGGKEMSEAFGKAIKELMNG